MPDRDALTISTMDETAFDELDIRRRRIRFRAWRRGLRELDILLGGFVDAAVGSLDAIEIAALESLLDAEDEDVYRWLSRTAPVPPVHDTPLFRKIIAFLADAPHE
jgi:antitoxin CptB